MAEEKPRAACGGPAGLPHNRGLPSSQVRIGQLGQQRAHLWVGGLSLWEASAMRLSCCCWKQDSTGNWLVSKHLCTPSICCYYKQSIDSKNYYQLLTNVRSLLSYLIIDNAG